MAYLRTSLHPITPGIVEGFERALLTGPSPTTINNVLDREFHDSDWRFVDARAPIDDPVMGFSIGGASPPTMLLRLNGALMHARRMLAPGDLLFNVRAFSMGQERMPALALQMLFSDRDPHDLEEVFIVPPDDDPTCSCRWVLSARFFGIKPHGNNMLVLYEYIGNTSFQREVANFCEDKPWNKLWVPEGP